MKKGYILKKANQDFIDDKVSKIDGIVINGNGENCRYYVHGGIVYRLSLNGDPVAGHVKGNVAYLTMPHGCSKAIGTVHYKKGFHA